MAVSVIAAAPSRLVGNTDDRGAPGKARHRAGTRGQSGEERDRFIAGPRARRTGRLPRPRTSSGREQLASPATALPATRLTDRLAIRAAEPGKQQLGDGTKVGAGPVPCQLNALLVAAAAEAPVRRRAPLPRGPRRGSINGHTPAGPATALPLTLRNQAMQQSRAARRSLLVRNDSERVDRRLARCPFRD
jgi:hypothetical protein